MIKALNKITKNYENYENIKKLIQNVYKYYKSIYKKLIFKITKHVKCNL